MHSFSSLKNLLIKDMIQTGWIDPEDQPAEVIVNKKWLFIDLDRCFLKLSSIEQYSKLKLEITDKIDFQELDPEEDLRQITVSVAELILTDTMAYNNIVSLKAYTPEEESDSITCLALSIGLACGQEIFIDPSFYFGLNIGGLRQKEFWIDNLAITHPRFTPEPVELME